MPYKSIAQQRYFNSNKKKLEGQGVDVDEWNKSTGNKKLPERIGKTKEQQSISKLKRAMAGKKK